MMESAIQPIARALAILCAVNRRHYATLQELNDDTGLPKPTIHRILSTLRQQGYIARDPDRGIYRLTAKVQLLSSGFNERSLITEIAVDILRSVTRKIQWPLALGTLDGTEVVVRCSTMPYSPCAVRATTVNNRHKLLGTAMGTAYLAYCSREERNILLGLVAQMENSAGEMARDARFVRQVLAQTRNRGYGLREGALRDDSATIAVPVLNAGHVAGVVSLTMFKRALTETALKRYPPILQDVAYEIAERIQQSERRSLRPYRAPETAA